MSCKHLSVLFLFVLLTACGQPHPSHIVDIRKISLQPIGAFPSSNIEFLQTQLSQFLHKQVSVLPPLVIPPSFRNDTKGERYSADSIVQFLANKTPDTRSIVIGLTTKDIFTTVRDWTGAVKKPVEKYAVWGIFGLGAVPGNSSIVSINRLQTSDDHLFFHRLRTVVFHELGHNLGLPHCPNPRCIMNDANEKIATVDNSGDAFCPSCLKKLN